MPTLVTAGASYWFLFHGSLAFSCSCSAHMNQKVIIVEFPPPLTSFPFSFTFGAWVDVDFVDFVFLFDEDTCF